MTKEPNIFNSWFYDENERKKIKKMDIETAALTAFQDIIEYIEMLDYHEIAENLLDRGYESIEDGQHDCEIWLTSSEYTFANMFIDFIVPQEKEEIFLTLFKDDNQKFKELEKRKEKMSEKINSYIKELKN